MRRITQEEYDALPIVDGMRECPGNTDYSAIARFGDYASFGADASFGAGARFGDYARFGADASFGAYARFGAYASFGADARFGAYARFGAGASFGERCQLENVTLVGPTIYSAGGFGSANRNTYGIPHAGGVRVCCGCFVGELDEFRQRVRETHGVGPIAREYLLMADLFEARRAREAAVTETAGATN